MIDNEKDIIIKECMEKTMHNGCGAPTCVAVVLLIVVLFFASCATRTRIEYSDRDVNHYITNTVHDTLIDKITDSVYVYITTKNDTVYHNVYKEKTRWRDRIVEKHDTCWRDSVVTEYKETTKEVVKFPKTYWWFLGISIISVIFAFVKVSRWLRMIL